MAQADGAGIDVMALFLTASGASCLVFPLASCNAKAFRKSVSVLSPFTDQLLRSETALTFGTLCEIGWKTVHPRSDVSLAAHLEGQAGCAVYQWRRQKTVFFHFPSSFIIKLPSTSAQLPSHRGLACHLSRFPATQHLRPSASH